MNEQSTETVPVIDNQCQVSLTETSSVRFAVVRLSGFRQRTSHMYTIIPSSKFHEKWLLQFCGEPWTFIWRITSLRLQMSSIHYEAKRSPVVAWQHWAFPHQLFCCVKEQIRRGGELQVCCLSSGGESGGSAGSDPSWQECPIALGFSIWTLSILYNVTYFHSCSVLRLELFAMCVSLNNESAVFYLLAMINCALLKYVSNEISFKTRPNYCLM